MNCIQCNKEFKGYGKICGSCRSRNSRDKSVALEPVADKSVATEIKSEQPKGWKGENMIYCTQHREHVLAYCKKVCNDCRHLAPCGHEVTQAIYGNSWKLVETCYDCVAERNNISRRNYPIHA